MAHGQRGGGVHGGVVRGGVTNPGHGGDCGGGGVSHGHGWGGVSYGDGRGGVSYGEGGGGVGQVVVSQTQTVDAALFLFFLFLGQSAHGEGKKYDSLQKKVIKI